MKIILAETHQLGWDPRAQKRAPENIAVVLELAIQMVMRTQRNEQLRLRRSRKTRSFQRTLWSNKGLKPSKARVSGSTWDKQWVLSMHTLHIKDLECRSS